MDTTDFSQCGLNDLASVLIVITSSCINMNYLVNITYSYVVTDYLNSINNGIDVVNVKYVGLHNSLQR